MESTKTAKSGLQAALDFIASGPKLLLIDGKWVRAVSGKTFDTINPATEEVLTAVAEADKADVDLAVKAARKAFETGPWSRMHATQRSKLIWKLGDLLEQIPLTSHLSAWYAAPTLLTLAAIAALALWTFRASLAGRPLFRDIILADQPAS